MSVLGIDIGGSGIKGALVDIQKGEFASDRHRIPTPQPSKPKAVADVIQEIVDHFDYEGAIGVTFPAIMKKGVAKSAANVDDEWVDTDIEKLFKKKTGLEIVALNDADAAGVAEMRFGNGKGRDGVVMLLTLGTGIGSALFIDGTLVPNTELGHIELEGAIGEDRASVRAMEEHGWSIKKWSKRLNRYLQHIEFIFSPDLLIIGGGISKKYDQFFPYLQLETEIVPAKLRNRAGIIGAAMAAKEQFG